MDDSLTKNFKALCIAMLIGGPSVNNNTKYRLIANSLARSEEYLKSEGCSELELNLEIALASEVVNEIYLCLDDHPEYLMSQITILEEIRAEREELDKALSKQQEHE